MGIGHLVSQLKQNGQDFEWYPTTREIIEAMYWDLIGKRVGEEELRASGKRFSLLDIGAGNCKLLTTIKDISEEQPLLNEYYIRDTDSKQKRCDYERFANRIFINKYLVIEKSQILLDNMPSEAIVVGTDFKENTLIDKRADVIFCNPPYSEYAAWSEKIIKESNANYIYLVIPQRWGKNRGIAEALKKRKAKVKIVGHFDFQNSEDRKARAKVSLVKVYLVKKTAENDWRYKYSTDKDKCLVDPFELWFNETFKISAQKSADTYYTAYGNHTSKQNKIRNEVVKGGDLVSTLVEMYNKELDTLVQNYQKVGELDSEILKELNVNVDNLLAAFKEKISGLKNLYWQEVFDNLKEITSRLTSSTRDRLLKKLAENTNIDFTTGNIRSMVIWVIKNADKYFEAQMLEVYDQFTTEDCIKLYKSNARWTNDKWRYTHELKEQKIKYALDYRIVLHSYFSEWDIRDGFIPATNLTKISDVITIAKNLNFSFKNDNISLANRFRLGEKDNIFFDGPRGRELKKGTKTLNMGKIEDSFLGEDGCYRYKFPGDGDWYHEGFVALEEDIFTTIKGFKNGNIHYQFNQKFIKKLNLEVARIRGWIKSPQEATTEFDITIEEANEYWNSSFNVLGQDLKNLLPNFNLTTNQNANDEEEAVKTVVTPSASKICPSNLLDLL